MFKIGEFSKLSMVSTKTLRYYDEIGLFKPAKIDRFSGYRYYSASQLSRLNRILALKDLGLSLDQITHLLESDLPPAEIRGMLRRKQVEIETQVREEQARLARVETRLRQIEQEGTMPTQEIVLKEIPAQTAATVRQVLPSMDQLGGLYEELFSYLAQHRVRFAGPAFTIYHDPEYHEQDVDVEVGVPVTDAVPSGDKVKTREMPAVKEMACIVHQGSYDTLSAPYNQLTMWIETNGYRIAGPPREIYVRGPETGSDPSTYVTEIQLPVAKG